MSCSPSCVFPLLVSPPAPSLPTAGAAANSTNPNPTLVSPLRLPRILRIPEVRYADPVLADKLAHIWSRSDSVGVCATISVPAHLSSRLGKGSISSSLRDENLTRWSTLGEDFRSFALVVRDPPRNMAGRREFGGQRLPRGGFYQERGFGRGM